MSRERRPVRVREIASAQIPFGSEVAGWVVLRSVERLRARGPLRLGVDVVAVDEAGEIVLLVDERARWCSEVEAARALRDLLELLLQAASSSTPALRLCAARPEPTGLDALERELSFALGRFDREAAAAACAKVHETLLAGPVRPAAPPPSASIPAGVGETDPATEERIALLAAERDAAFRARDLAVVARDEDARRIAELALELEAARAEVEEVRGTASRDLAAQRIAFEAQLAARQAEAEALDAAIARRIELAAVEGRRQAADEAARRHEEILRLRDELAERDRALDASKAAAGRSMADEERERLQRALHEAETELASLRGKDLELANASETIAVRDATSSAQDSIIAAQRAALAETAATLEEKDGLLTHATAALAAHEDRRRALEDDLATERAHLVGARDELRAARDRIALLEAEVATRGVRDDAGHRSMIDELKRTHAIALSERDRALEDARGETQRARLEARSEVLRARDAAIAEAEQRHTRELRQALGRLRATLQDESERAAADRRIAQEAERATREVEVEAIRRGLEQRIADLEGELCRALADRDAERILRIDAEARALKTRGRIEEGRGRTPSAAHVETESSSKPLPSADPSEDEASPRRLDRGTVVAVVACTVVGAAAAFLARGRASPQVVAPASAAALAPVASSQPIRTCLATVRTNGTRPGTEVLRRLGSTPLSVTLPIEPASDVVLTRRGSRSTRIALGPEAWTGQPPSARITTALASLEPLARPDGSTAAWPRATEFPRAPVTDVLLGRLSVDSEPSDAEVWIGVDPMRFEVPCGSSVELLVVAPFGTLERRTLDWRRFHGAPPRIEIALAP
jgi:hypothetical protein